MLSASPQEMEGEAADDQTAQDDQEATAEAQGDDQPAGPQPRRDRPDDEPPSHYRAFSRQFDEEIAAEDLCDADELARLRQQLDQQLQHLQGVVSRLANRLQRRLMAQQTRAWEFDLEEGMLDAGRGEQASGAAAASVPAAKAALRRLSEESQRSSRSRMGTSLGT